MGVKVRWGAALLGGLLAAAAAQAQIRIGQTAGFSGPVAAGVKEVSDGAKLYLDAINKAGGVGGQQIEVIALDDKFEPPLAAENAKKLIDQGVIALFLTRGTPHTQAVLPLLAQYKVPLIGPSTGAMVLHSPVNPWVFNVRATYQREAERAIRHLSLIGVDRIAVVQVDDSFGADAATGALNGFTAVGKQPALHEKFDRNKPDMAPIIPKVIKADAQAVLFIGSGNMVADGVKQLRAAGSRAQVVTLSNNASAGFVKSLGDNARGTVVSQVFPYERSLSAPIVKEAIEFAKAAGKGEVTPAMLEGYAAAKVLVEGLKRAGPQPTREKLKTALETFRRVDIGGLEVSFSANDHSGLDYADLSIVGEDGRFKR
ncbi:MAG: ABC transporter substrate-binding protein [Pseudomonadota bacterium]